MESKRKTLLVVDDNDDTCEFLAVMLEQEGIDCVAVASATKALQIIEIQQFDLYVLDVNLPDISGLELCKKIREIDRQTPVVFYTAAAFPNDVEAGLMAGADAYLVKPQVEELVPTIKRYVSTIGRFPGSQSLS